jgi:adenosylcobyric acid synthase
MRTRPATFGTVARDGVVAGTLLHGIFDHDGVRASLLAFLRRRRGLPPAPLTKAPSRDHEYDRVAAALREHIDVAAIRRIAALPPP